MFDYFEANEQILMSTYKKHTVYTIHCTMNIELKVNLFLFKKILSCLLTRIYLLK